MEAKIHQKSSQVASGTPPDGRSDFGRLFGPSLGGPMCLKYNKYFMQLTFRTCDKSRFLAPFLPPFWKPLGLFFAILLLAGPLQNKVQKNALQKSGPGPENERKWLPKWKPKVTS